MILEIDVGNTRLKWRLLSVGDAHADGVAADSVIERGFVMTATLTSVYDVNLCFGNIAASQLVMIRIGTVVSLLRELLTLWAAQYSLVPVFAQTSASHGAVVNAYNDVDQMGVDRWLGIVAAYNKVSGACLIVDAGSAVTIDLVADGGQHLGGYIVPGLQMMRHSLFGQTDQVESNAEKTSAASVSFALSPGNNTQDAVANGLPLMLLGVIRQVLSDVQADYGVTPFVLLTGGDGAFLERLVRNDVTTEVKFLSELVMDGLSLVAND
jgi:type III pantothenate kinase